MPRLKVISPSNERTEYEFGDVTLSIGREQDNMIVLDDPLVSRYHAVVSLSDGVWCVHDQDSTHGIWVGKKKVSKLLLKDRESFTIGDHKFRFSLHSRGDGADPQAVSRPNTPRPKKKHKQKRGVAAPEAANVHAVGRESKTEKTNVPAPECCMGKNTEVAEIPGDIAAATPSSFADTGKVAVATEASKSECQEASGSKAPIVTELVASPPAGYPPTVSQPVASGMDKLVLPQALNSWVWFVLGGGLVGVISIFYLFVAAKAPPAKEPAMVKQPVSPLPQKVLPGGFVSEGSEQSPEGGVLPGRAALTTSPDESTNPAKALEMLPPPNTAAKLPLAGPSLPHKNVPMEMADTTQIESRPGMMRVLFQPAANDLGQQPVLSPDLQHVLHFSKAVGRATGLGDLLLDQRIVRQGVQVATAADLRFSADGSKWMAFTADSSGRRSLALPDRSYIVRGHLQAMLGSRDFSVVAYVERQDDEDSLYLNGEKVASYMHITAPRLSTDGRHWAYIAMKQLDADLTEFAPGERVVTDAWSGPVHAHISDLTLNDDGSRIAYVAHSSNGAQTLWLNQKAVFEVKPFTDRQLSQLTLASQGERCAWAVLSKEGTVEFHADGAPPLIANVARQVGGSTLFSRDVPTARILFSADGKHVAFAAVGKSAIVARDGVVIGTYPSLQADLLSFSPDGSKVAHVALHPLRSADTGSDGVSMQPHAAVLQVNDKAEHTVPIFVHKLPGVFPVILGGLDCIQFSPDSQRLAYLFTPVRQAENSELMREMWINGRKLKEQMSSVEAFQWVSQTTIRLVSRRDNSLWIFNLECSN